MKRASFIFIAVLCTILCATSCSSTRRSKVKFHSLGVEAFSKFIQQDDVYLVDVRTPEEHAAGSIEGTDENLNVRSADFFKEFKRLPQDKTIALYCKGGGRSKQVAGVLAGNGYRVVELSVGYDGWVKHHAEQQEK
ncbi:MAG: rhodanese-like domain-containing protein [Alistipes sp.]|nr:rhodanese-like domain-containing protein [Alistipes sp.]